MVQERVSSKVIRRERRGTTRALPGANTSIAAFLGIAEKGPLGPVRVRSNDAFQRVFGGPIAVGELANVVAGYFENEGSEAWIARTMHFTDITDQSTALGVAAAGYLTTPGAATPATITGTNPGPFALSPGDRLTVDVDGGGDVSAIFDATQSLLI